MAYIRDLTVGQMTSHFYIFLCMEEYFSNIDTFISSQNKNVPKHISFTSAFQYNIMSLTPISAAPFTNGH